MRIFKHPNTSFGWKCPICKKDDDKECILISIAGTQDGGICEAEQFHMSCLDFWWYPENNLIAMKIEDNNANS